MCEGNVNIVQSECQYRRRKNQWMCIAKVSSRVVYNLGIQLFGIVLSVGG